MKSYVQSNVSEQKRTRIQEDLWCWSSNSPLSIALWQDGYVTWLYPSLEEPDSYQEPTFTIRSINSTKEYELIRVRLYNNERNNKFIKVVVLYCHEHQKNTTTFYSPYEKAIISYSDESVMMIGGNLNGVEMNQYAIQPKGKNKQKQLFRQLEKGKLPLSWLAQGEVCSTFTLEAELTPFHPLDGMIWTFQSSSEEKVKSLKKEVLPGFL